jgi:phosphoglycolate phosphatase
MTLAVAFDLDGTLIDSAPDIHAAVNRALATLDLPGLTATQVKGSVGNGAPLLLSRCLAALGQAHEGPLHNELYKTFIGFYDNAFALTALYPNVRETLNALSNAGLPMGICTNKPQSPTLAVLRHFGLLGFFSAVVGGDSLPKRKPDPAPLHFLINALGNSSAVFVGDSEVDAETAEAARVPFLLFTEGYRKSPLADLHPRASFSDFSALPGLIAGL